MATRPRRPTHGQHSVANGCGYAVRMSLQAMAPGKSTGTDETAVRAYPDGLTEGGAITPLCDREHGNAELSINLAGGR